MITGAGYENFPLVLQPAFQQNMLDREFQDQLEPNCVVRTAVYRKPQPVRSGEVTIYSRAGELVPVVDDIDPTTNVNIDNGLTNVGGIGAANPTYGVEQYKVIIGMTPYALDLNLYQERELVADGFKKNIENLGRQAGLSLDLKAINVLLRAYEGGRTYATAASATSGANTTVHVDNIYGFDTAFATATIQGYQFPYGLPQATSSVYPLPAYYVNATTGAKTAITILAAVPDGSNTSTMAAPLFQVGFSGTLTIQGTGITAAANDIIYAADAPAYYRPGTARSRVELSAASTTTLQTFINIVAGFRLNQVRPPLPDGTFPCFIDPILDAQMFSDPAFQILTQGAEKSSSYANARVLKNFGMTFVPTTNMPIFTFTNTAGKTLFARRAVVCADRFVQEAPFAGVATVAAELTGRGISDIRMVKDIAMVHRLPIDRMGQIMSQGWFYIGGFTVPTDATITPAVIPSATPARYKRAAVFEVGSQV
jgi:ElaB/YqjD/DUF883 family membrane-anchored ribosome-binding protein